MKHLWRRWLRDQRGAAAVEFAMIAMAFLLFVLLVFEAGRMLWTLNGMEDAASVASRCRGMQRSSFTMNGATYSCQTDTAATAYLVAYANGRLPAGDQLTAADVTLVSNDTSQCLASSPQNFVRVTVSYTWTSVVTRFANTPLTVTACHPVLGG